MAHSCGSTDGAARSRNRIPTASVPWLKLELPGLGFGTARSDAAAGDRRRSHRQEQRMRNPPQLDELRGFLAEDRGFEPLRALTQPAFQASAIGH